MKFFSRKRGARAVVAGVAAAAMLSAPVLAYAGDGGGGSAGGGTGAGGNGGIQWVYKDSYGPANRDSVVAALSEAGVTVSDVHGTGWSTIDQAISTANSECVARSQGHGDEQPNCRLVSVGFVSTDGIYTGSTGGFTAKRWQDAWVASGIPNNTYYYQGVGYTTSDAFNDGVTNINSLVKRETDKAPNIAIVTIVLNQWEPPVIKSYDLTVTTNQQAPSNMRVGATDAVHDVIHASNSLGTKEDLAATVWFHYDGNAYVGSKAVSKSVTITSQGDTTSPDFTPGDFGWDHWPAGTHWFDVDVPKSGNMNAAVNTADRDAAETFTVTATPPPAPSKHIEKGVSADAMTNRTTITSETGAGGYEMTFTDRINPNGVDYTIGGYSLVDTTDGRDVSNEFSISWDKGSDTVTAVRTADKGELPIDHTYEFSFDVTVSLPKDFKKVEDQAAVKWNQEPEQSTDSHEFGTWEPNPDKSWIRKGEDGKWAAVIDPQETNGTGADNMKFLDGDQVASVVNGTVGSDLIESPSALALSDDWSAADYIFDGPTDAKDVKVYAAEASTDRESSVSDIVNTGDEITENFDIKVEGTTVVATAKSDWLQTLKGLDKPLQLTLLVPGTINFANGGGAAQVREDFGKAAGDELTFCTSPSGADLTNSGSETFNGDTEDTNEPKICGYVPPTHKDVLAEASQGGDQDSVDGKVVYPGQKVEYTLTTQPNLPSDLATTITKVVFTDSYDKYLVPDKQTVEMMDLSDGKVVAKSKYATKWDDSSHTFQLTVTDQGLINEWRAGGSPRIQVRFEGTVGKDAPAAHKVGNKWVLTLNNSLTSSNEVFNVPPEFTPSKEDNQSDEQGDPSISIDGKTLLMGDTGSYVVDLDLTQQDQAYKVWRAGVVDDYDDEYLQILASDVEILDASGQDVTSKFNVQIRDGVLYAFAKTVDTEIPATGETVKGDPQPDDLKAYSEMTDKDYDPLKDPSIDQSLLGQTYRVVMPYKVIKVDDGYVVENTATQLVNDQSKKTNTVSNPLKPINPAKDVTVKVGGESVDGQSVYLDSTFLYQLDSSVLPSDRAYPAVSEWGIDDQLDPEYDVLTGQWAVYAARDLYRDGQVIAAKGDRIAGSGFDSSKLGGDMFVASLDAQTGAVTIESTELYRQLVGADTAHEQAWRAYIQCKRAKVTDRHENQFTERYNGQRLTSNVVWTRTPDLTPSLKIEKWDEASGFPDGDRDTTDQALEGAKDGDVIVFTITNTSKSDGDKGAWFKASDLKLEDETIVGDGTVTDLKYPDNWDTLVLKPGDSVDVKGTLTGFTQDKHTDRAKVTGTPLVECPVVDDDPFGDGGDGTDGDKGMTVTIDGRTLCQDTQVESDTDDWNGKPAPSLAQTGASIALAAGIVVILAGAAGSLTVMRRKATASASAGRHTAANRGE